MEQSKSKDRGILRNRVPTTKVPLVIGLVLAIFTLGTGSDQGLSVTASVRKEPKTELSFLHFRMEQTPEHAPPSRLSVLVRGQRIDLRGLAPGSRLGRLRVESSNSDQLDLEMRLRSRSGADRSDLEIFFESSKYPDLPLAEGTLTNTATGFEMKIQIADRILDLRRRFFVPQSLAAEIDFEIPLDLSDNNNLSLSVTSTH